ncbi:hypothetical protein [Xanthomonas sp. NCPPB 2632]|uniref:hypothetical protein n=1 Tax=Xanthomonas sp. NCPPB 2632 TaxID=3240912 RepID=UPI0035167056
MLRNLITGLKFGRISSLWMSATGLVPDDGGAIGRRAAVAVSQQGMPANDAWLLALLEWISEQPAGEQVIAANGVRQFLEAQEGRIELHPSTRQAMHEVARQAVVSPSSNPRPGPLDVMSIPNLAGRVASAIDVVLNSGRSYTLTRGCMRLPEEGAVSFWPEPQSPHGSIVASVKLADIAAVGLLSGPLAQDEHWRSMTVDSVAIEVVRRFHNQVQMLSR